MHNSTASTQWRSTTKIGISTNATTRTAFFTSSAFSRPSWTAAHEPNNARRLLLAENGPKLISRCERLPQLQKDLEVVKEQMSPPIIPSNRTVQICRNGILGLSNQEGQRKLMCRRYYRQAFYSNKKIPTRQNTSTEVPYIFLNNWIISNEIPKYTFTEVTHNLPAKVLKHSILCIHLGTKQLERTACYPQTNGYVERNAFFNMLPRINATAKCLFSW